MSAPIIYSTEDLRAQISVVNQQLTTAAAGNQRSTVKKSPAVQEMLA